MTSTIDQLFAAILAAPEDDTLRLAYADALADLPTMRIPCPQFGYADGEPHALCAVCQGACTVINNENRDRAELIREQIRLEKLARLIVSPQCGSVSDRWCQVCGDCTCRDPEQSLSDAGCPLHDEDSPHAGTSERMRAVEERGWRIVAANPRWSRAVCPECEGRRRISLNDGTTHPCELCDETGDLMTCRNWLPYFEQFGPPVPREPVFKRGFIDSVQCEFDEAIGEQDVHCPDCNGLGAHPQHNGECGFCNGTAFVGEFFATPWALAVVQSVPTITRLEITDREPYWNGGAYCWFRRNRPNPSLLVPESGIIPDMVFENIPTEGRHNQSRARRYLTPGDAKLALAIGVCNTVRKSVSRKAAAA